MLKQQENVFRRLMIIIDTFVVSAAFFVAYSLRIRLNILDSFEVLRPQQLVEYPISMEAYFPTLFNSFVLITNYE